MVVLEVVPQEIVFTPVTGMGDAVKASWVSGLVLLGLELAFAEEVLVAHVGTAMGFGHAEVCQQQGHCLGGMIAKAGGGRRSPSSLSLRDKLA